MAARIPPKVMAKQLVRVLRRQRADDHHLKKVFQHTRELLEVGSAPPAKRLPELLTDAELVAFYEAVWHARQLTHAVMIKCTGTLGFHKGVFIMRKLVVSSIVLIVLAVGSGLLPSNADANEVLSHVSSCWAEMDGAICPSTVTILWARMFDTAHVRSGG